MATLQRNLIGARGRKRYYRWRVNLPPQAINELGWPEGARIRFSAQEGKLVGERE